MLENMQEFDGLPSMDKPIRPQWNGANLRALRELRQLSADQLGAAVGSNRSQISKWERGENVPGGDYLIAFAVFFNVNATYFFTGTESYQDQAVKRMTEYHVASVQPRYTPQELEEMSRSPLPGRRARAELNANRLAKPGDARDPSANDGREPSENDRAERTKSTRGAPAPSKGR